VYLNNPQTLDEFNQSNHETVKSVEVIELKLGSHNIFKDLKSVLDQQGEILIIYCDGESFKYLFASRSARPFL
jgi:hypothetical protein